MSLKMEFVERARAGEKIAALCREYGISRQTGHKLLKRFEAMGYEGLEEQSRRPKTAPLATAEEIVIAVLKARDAHPRWGPRKLHPLIRRRLGEQAPSPRTIARILRRADLVRDRRQRRPPSVVERAPRVTPKAPNDVWTVDFKGWWHASNGERCDPLTVRDAFSRYVLAVVVCNPTTDNVRGVFEELFRRHGVPAVIQCDNGAPFVSVRSRAGISTLSAWWLSLGIRLVRSRPGCPQDNGGHERMHADIAADIEVNPGADAVDEQRRLDRWRQEFNHARPHDALGGKTPVDVYKVTNRRRPEVVAYRYGAGLYVRRVSRSGHFRIRNDTVFVGNVFAEHYIGVELVDARHVRAWFRDVDLGLIETAPDVDDSCFETMPRPAALTLATNIPNEAARMQETRANDAPGGS